MSHSFDFLFQNLNCENFLTKDFNKVFVCIWLLIESKAYAMLAVKRDFREIKNFFFVLYFAMKELRMCWDEWVTMFATGNLKYASCYMHQQEIL